MVRILPFFPALVLLPSCKPTVAKQPAAAIKSVQINALSGLSEDEITDKLRDLGCEVRWNKGKPDVSIFDTPHRCIPYINLLPELDGFNIAYTHKKISYEAFKELKPRPEITFYLNLYGSLSKKAYTLLPQKFPNIEEFTLWGLSESDISQLPALPKMKEFSNDWEHTITIAEAKQLVLSRNLEEVDVEGATSPEVFEILKTLPKIKELHVRVFNQDGTTTTLTLP